jgi:hypothetical protein
MLNKLGGQQRAFLDSILVVLSSNPRLILRTMFMKKYVLKKQLLNSMELNYILMSLKSSCRKVVSYYTLDWQQDI